MHTTEVITSFDHHFAVDDVVTWPNSHGRTYRITKVNTPKEPTNPEAVLYDLECISGGEEYVGKKYLDCILTPKWVELVDNPTFTYTITVKQYGDRALHNIGLGAEGIREYLESSPWLSARGGGGRYEVSIVNDDPDDEDESFIVWRR